ncbi:GNAT family N-acetyltransferase [Chamaesiphon sp. VAR_48_metabat_403]|uniref:GNAT family N-acetyltransferase n=1 Tax=Chamaesiphon sp. VAR_48_metabat_403 TaxID=2964700 RepID=UPI0037BE242F
MEIVRVRFEDLAEVAELFDRYRVFYNKSSDLAAARSFLEERLEQKDSTIFIARSQMQIVGFTQLYPSFSSVSMKRVWILNDLFIDEIYRKQGIAKLLMNAVANFARDTGAIRIILSTQVTNLPARSLYRSLGYIQDDAFDRYALSL